MLFMAILEYYFLAGIVFAIAFLFVGFKSILPEAAGSKLRVRLLWTPAAVAIWPLLVSKWIKTGG